MSEFDQKAFAERLIKIRKEYTVASTKIKFAEALGVGHTCYSRYEKDTIPPIPVLLRICKLTGTDAFQLITGNPHTRKEHPHIEPQLLDKIESLLKLTPESQQAIEAFVDLLMENNIMQGKTSPERPEREKRGWIPILGRTAAGVVHFWSQSCLPTPEEAVSQLEKIVEKYTSIRITNTVSKNILQDLTTLPGLSEIDNSSVCLIDIHDDCSDKDGKEFMRFVEAKAIHELFPDAFGLQVDGDSMSPRINDGDIVIVSPSVRAAEAHPAVVSLDGQIGVTCKLFRTSNGDIHLIPINKGYPVQRFRADKMLWGLAVLCHIEI